MHRRTILAATPLIVGVGAVTALAGCWDEDIPDRKSDRGSYPDVVKGNIGHRDYSVRSTVDWALQRFSSTNPLDASTAGQGNGLLPWSVAYAMDAYLTMYEATGDEAYLDDFIRAGDQVAALRDADRGITDYEGRSQPAWFASAPYTATYGDVHDINGRTILRVRTMAASRTPVTMAVLPGVDGTFNLRIDAGDKGVGTLTDVSADPTSDRYVTRVLAARKRNPLGITIVDLEPSAAGERQVLATRDPEQMASTRYIFAAHTGLIGNPYARFSALVKRRNVGAQYPLAAGRYLEIARSAYQVHDREWREDDTFGWYEFPKGAPVGRDGTELPHNQYLAMARLASNLFRATGDEMYRRHARKMFATFRGDLTVDADGAASWPYYWTRSRTYRGYQASDDVSLFTPTAAPATSPEDVSHGASDVMCAAAGFATGMGLTSADMEALNKTYRLRLVEGPDAIRANVRGAGVASDKSNYASALWSVLEPWGSGIHSQALSIYTEAQYLPTHGQVVLGAALLHASSLPRWRGIDG